MTDTTNLALPLIEGAQAQKHVTHNEALLVLDTLVQLAVLDRDLNAPPAAPSAGQRWIVKANPAPRLGEPWKSDCRMAGRRLAIQFAQDRLARLCGR